MTVLRMIRRGDVPARQLCKGAPWVIKVADIDTEAVRTAAGSRRRIPLTADPAQQALILQ
jgi:hypothetical protein